MEWIGRTYGTLPPVLDQGSRKLWPPFRMGSEHAPSASTRSIPSSDSFHAARMLSHPVAPQVFQEIPQVFLGAVLDTDDASFDKLLYRNQCRVLLGEVRVNLDCRKQVIIRNAGSIGQRTGGILQPFQKVPQVRFGPNFVNDLGCCLDVF